MEWYQSFHCILRVRKRSAWIQAQKLLQTNNIGCLLVISGSSC